MLEVIAVLLLINLLVTLLVLFRHKGRGDGKTNETLRQLFRENREDSSKEAKLLREEIGTQQKQNTEILTGTITQLNDVQTGKLQEMAGRIERLSTGNEKRLERLTERVGGQLDTLRQSNEKKLEQMRETVDEKLQGTLEKRLGESFKLVSERLEAVQKGLGEMQELATGVGDLKAVLTNVKARGTWGEVQLGALLEEMLAPNQFARNVKPRPGSEAIVEYAIRLPGRDRLADAEVLLPIDAKFPQEDYNRLTEASEKGDAASAQRATDALLRTVEGFAKDIRDKYVEPPHTTDFAILYLPTEGLYAEVVRSPDLLDRLQRNYRIVVAGPTTLAAILNSLQMGFRTLAIEKRSSEVWEVLSKVKNEFGKFGEVLDRVKKQINTVSNSLEQTDVRRRAMKRALSKIEQAPDTQSDEPFIEIEHEDVAFIDDRES